MSLTPEQIAQFRIDAAAHNDAVKVELKDAIAQLILFMQSVNEKAGELIVLDNDDTLRIRSVIQSVVGTGILPLQTQVMMLLNPPPPPVMPPLPNLPGAP